MDGSRPSHADENEDKPCGYPCPDAVSVDACDEVATKTRMGVDCEGRGAIPLKGHLEPLLFGGGITQDEIARQPGSQTNFGGRSEARDISLIRGNARQSCATVRPAKLLHAFLGGLINQS